jgi:Sigma-70 region 2
MAAAQLVHPDVPTRGQTALRARRQRRAEESVELEIAQMALRIGNGVAARHPSVKTRHVSADEMASRAILEAWRAAKKYDPSTGAPLSSYMQMKASFGCGDFLREEGWFSRSVHASEAPPRNVSIDDITFLELPASGLRSDASALHNIMTEEVSGIIETVSQTRTPWHGDAFKFVLGGASQAQAARKFQCTEVHLGRICKDLTAKAAAIYQERYCE